MKIQPWIKQGGCVLLCAAMLTACGQEKAPTNASASASSASTVSAAADTKEKTLGYADEMNKTQIMSFSINADEAKWQDMLDHASEEEYIPADVTINGTTIKNVGIRPKGNSSLRQIVNDETTDRYSFKIKFDEYVDGQTWMGLDKLALNNMYSDNSYLKEYISYDLMSYIGVDAPLVSFANIDVNGKAWGFYLAVEVIDSGYLDRTKDGEGELYKPNNDDKGMNEMGAMKGDPMKDKEMTANPPAAQGEGAAPPQRPAGNAAPTGMQPPDGNRGGGRGMNGAQNGVSLEYTDNAVSSYSAIFDNAETKTKEEDEQRVITALQHLNEGTDLETYVDVDAVLRYFAAHTVVVNMDSYTSSMGHNYYLYENNGQISILPWDYNLSFGGFQSGTASDIVNLAIDTPLSGVSLEQRPLLGKLLEVPEYKQKYHQYLQEIVDGYFADGQFEQTVANLNHLISDDVKNDPSAFCTFEEYEASVAELTKIGTLRAESIDKQLKGEIPSTTEGQKADTSKRVDASSIDLTKMGGFGKGGPGGEGFGGPGGFPGSMDPAGGPQRRTGPNEQPSDKQ
ncbi:hypothetical protein PAESOLCIP111_03796 [Paenibacillus solanacearum]|uniref:Spore coat protein CotH n=1 Tax=Paenibacillus solanacearum TaxID=2048548 RepID=A0A916K6P6_9BACL|nr:CotH kinase family protein [Paenibacillus solanacearum]CAG7636910.1 hypothetical protein PAESOLCIP111_03796 [Paenibacillus solanacearum]